MRKVPAESLAFTDEFIRFTETHRGWPGYRDVQMKMETYAKLRNGEAADAKYARRVVGYILQNRDQDCCKSLDAFFRDRGWPAPATLAIEDVVGRVCVALDRETAGSKVGLQCLLDGIGGVAKAYANIKAWHECLQGCASPAAVEEAIDWFFVETGRLVAGDPLLPVSDATSIVGALTGTSLSHHQSRAIEWSNYNRWTVVRCLDKKQHPVAMSLCLPITSAAADLLLGGHMMPQECLPDTHLELPARTIFIPIVAVRPRDLGGKPGDFSTPLSLAIAAQIAALTNSQCDRRPKSIRLLCIGGSPLAARLLTEWRFTNCGVPVRPNQQIFFYERKLRADSPDSNDDSFMHVLKSLWKKGVCHSMPPPT